MAFRFNLQRVLELRADAVDEAARRLEELKEACEKLRILLQSELDAYFGEREEYNARSRDGDFQGLPFLERALEARKRRMLEVMASLRGLEDETRLAEHALTLAKREHRVVEVLREKREAEYVKTMDAKERKFLDEMTTLRFARRAREGGT